MDVKHPYSYIDESSKTSQLQTLATQLAGVEKKYESAVDPKYAFVHATSEDETNNLGGFSSGDKLSAFFTKFYGLKVLPNFSTQQKPTFFKESSH